MVNFPLDMDTYFWLIDKAQLQDDPRNEVLVEYERVNLHRELTQKLFNGVHIATLL